VYRPTTALAACLAALALVLAIGVPIASADLIFLTPVTVSVTTDSVVATATVDFGGAPTSLVTVAWGDGTTTAWDPNSVSAISGQPPSPTGKAVVQHAYTPPADGSAFTRAVSTTVAGQGFQQVVTVTPRFRVSALQTSFNPLSNCDSFVEYGNEWHLEEIVQLGGVLIFRDKTWDFDTDVQPGPLPLSGSEISFDMTMADKPILVTWAAKEVDPLFDDVLDDVSFNLPPRVGSHHESHFTAQGDDTSCAAIFNTDVGVQLLRPGLIQGGGGHAMF